MEKGWRGFREVNRVRFDPNRIRLDELEKRLKQAGTYVETVD